MEECPICGIPFTGNFSKRKFNRERHMRLHEDREKAFTCSLPCKYRTDSKYIPLREALGLDLLAGITCIVLYKLSRKVHCGLKIPIWFGRELLNNSCVLYCAAVSEKYEDQSQRNPYVTLSRLAPHFEDEIAGLQKRPFLAGFGLFWTHFVCM